MLYFRFRTDVKKTLKVLRTRLRILFCVKNIIKVPLDITGRGFKKEVGVYEIFGNGPLKKRASEQKYHLTSTLMPEESLRNGVKFWVLQYLIFIMSSAVTTTREENIDTSHSAV